MRNPSGKDAFNKGADLLATAGGFGLAFFVTPLVYHASIDAALEFSRSQYGYDWDWVVPILCGLGSAVISFAGCQILLSLTLRLGFAKLAELTFR